MTDDLLTTERIVRTVLSLVIVCSIALLVLPRLAERFSRRTRGGTRRALFNRGETKGSEITLVDRLVIDRNNHFVLIRWSGKGDYLIHLAGDSATLIARCDSVGHSGATLISSSDSRHGVPEGTIQLLRNLVKEEEFPH